jgi:signal transduction histidine kinase
VSDLTLDLPMSPCEIDHHGFGLCNMRERMELMKGTLEIESRAGKEVEKSRMAKTSGYPQTASMSNFVPACPLSEPRSSRQ